jgi:hypothetical protein
MGYSLQCVTEAANGTPNLAGAAQLRATVGSSCGILPSVGNQLFIVEPGRRSSQPTTSLWLRTCQKMWTLMGHRVMANKNVHWEIYGKVT